ncbi:MAG: T9SS type A sorting domain-containing protein [Ignavibacteriaceae bacterium]
MSGVLKANLCTFTSKSGTTQGSWGNITLSGSGTNSSNLSNVIIQYGSGIQFLSGADAVLQNSTINNCTEDVYIYNAAPSIIGDQIINPSQCGIYIDASGYSPAIYSNLIKMTTGQSTEGIYILDNSAPYISNNRIGGFVYGIYGGGGSITRLQGSSFPSQNNLIYGNGYGLTAGWGSTIYGGYQGNGMYNSIHGNTSEDAYSYHNSYLYAEYDYWGSTPLRATDGTGGLDYNNNLGTNDPWKGATPSIEKKNNSYSLNELASVTIPNPSITDSSSTDPFSALNLEDKGDLSGAIIQYMGLIAKDNHADFAITELFKLFNQFSRTDILTYFETFTSSNKHYPLVSKLIADYNLQTGEFDKAISTYDNLIKNYSNDYYGINARFQKLFAYVNVKNDLTKAQQMLTQIKSLNLTDLLWTVQIEQAESMIGSSSKSNNSEISIPAGYSIANYPNPFNPTTMIQYQIPSNGMVTLKVFDVLGREIKTLVSEYKQQGTYTVSFDASKLASGIYFYQIRSGNYISTKKMMYMK